MTGKVTRRTRLVGIGKHFQITSQYRRFLEFLSRRGHRFRTLSKRLKRSNYVDRIIHLHPERF